MWFSKDELKMADIARLIIMQSDKVKRAGLPGRVTHWLVS